MTTPLSDLLSDSELSKEINRIVRSKWWEKQFANLIEEQQPLSIAIHDNRLTETMVLLPNVGSNYSDRVQVHLYNPWRRDRWSRLDVCRAVTHAIVQATWADSVPSHGKEFAKTFLMVVAKWGFRNGSSGTADKAALRDAFKTAGVKYIWRSEETKEAARRRKQVSALLEMRADLT